jgi:hypothetical protein
MTKHPTRQLVFFFFLSLTAAAAIGCSHSSMSVPDLPPPQLTDAGSVLLTATTPDSVQVRADRVSVTIPDSELFDGRIWVDQSDDVSVSSTSTVSFHKSANPFRCRIDNLLVRTRELLVERLPIKVLTGRWITFDGAVEIMGRAGNIRAWKAWVESDCMDFSRTVALRFILDSPCFGGANEEELIELKLYNVHDLVTTLRVSESQLAENVRANACPEAWGRPGRSIEATKDVLVVTATEKEHKEVTYYIGSQRSK